MSTGKIPLNNICSMYLVHKRTLDGKNSDNSFGCELNLEAYLKNKLLSTGNLSIFISTFEGLLKTHHYLV